ncbi:hypothetical protein SBA3_3140032 [Candidatus Sulfopaludibacter sp. SbA3]|nr:hypothetical protein SBA3_3140032 [Candidatus Sulfopaludibacter sp. SbA3]
MSLTIFTTDDDAGFVTGDEPCCLGVPGEAFAFFNHEDVELTLPLTLRHLAVYSWKLPFPMFSRLNQVGVDRINSRTVAHCGKVFVYWKGIVRDEWLQPDLRRQRDRFPDLCRVVVKITI